MLNFFSEPCWRYDEEWKVFFNSWNTCPNFFWFLVTFRKKWKHGSKCQTLLKILFFGVEGNNGEYYYLKMCWLWQSKRSFFRPYLKSKACLKPSFFKHINTPQNPSNKKYLWSSVWHRWKNSIYFLCYRILAACYFPHWECLPILNFEVKMISRWLSQ